MLTFLFLFCFSLLVCKIQLYLDFFMVYLCLDNKYMFFFLSLFSDEQKLVILNKEVLLSMRTNFDKPDQMKELFKKLQRMYTIFYCDFCVEYHEWYPFNHYIFSLMCMLQLSPQRWIVSYRACRSSEWFSASDSWLRKPWQTFLTTAFPSSCHP